MRSFLIAVCLAVLCLTANPLPKQIEADVVFASNRGFNRGFRRNNQIIINPQFNRFNRGFNNQLQLNNRLLQQQLLQQQLLNQQQFQFQRFGLNGCGF